MFFAPWEELLGSPARVRILRALLGAGRGLSGREASRLARTSLPIAQRALATLVAAGVVLREEASAQHLYRINGESLLVREGLGPLFAAEERRVGATFEALMHTLWHDVNTLDIQPLGAYLFGSAARGDDRAESDFDLLVIAADDAAAERLHDRLSTVSPELRRRMGIVLSPVVIGVARARELAEDPSSVVAAAVREGRRIHGQELERIIDGEEGEEEAR